MFIYILTRSAWPNRHLNRPLNPAKPDYTIVRCTIIFSEVATSVFVSNVNPPLPTPERRRPPPVPKTKPSIPGTLWKSMHLVCYECVCGTFILFLHIICTDSQIKRRTYIATSPPSEVTKPPVNRVESSPSIVAGTKPPHRDPPATVPNRNTAPVRPARRPKGWGIIYATRVYVMQYI